MSEITVGARVRSLRDTIPGVEHNGGYLGRHGTVVEIDGDILVLWDDDVPGEWWWWHRADLEIVAGDGE